MNNVDIPTLGVYGVHDLHNDMWYIGSSINIESRFKNHAKAISEKTGIFKGIDVDDCDFEYNILKVLTTDKTLELWENYYIGFFDSIKRGYNKKIALRNPILSISYYRTDTSEITIMDDEELFCFLKLKTEADFLEISARVPSIEISGTTKRYIKKDVINFLLKESRVNKYYSKMDSETRLLDDAINFKFRKNEEVNNEKENTIS